MIQQFVCALLCLLAPTTPALPQELEHTVLVVDRAGQPVPGARGFFLERAEFPLANLLTDVDSDAWTIEHGTPVESDGTGRIRLQTIAEGQPPGSLFVEHDVGWASLLVPPGAGTIRLALQVDRGVVARTVDPAGRPLAGVRVGLFIEGLRRRSAVSDGDGRVHLSRLVDGRKRSLAEGTRCQLALDFPAPAELALSVLVQAERAPPAALVVPEAGSVRVVLEDWRGEVYRGRALVSLGFEGAPMTLEHSRPAVDGVVLFPTVAAIDSPLLVHCSSVGHSTAPLTIQPPRSADEVTEVRVPWAPARPVLVGRVLDDRGEPLAGQALYITFPDGGRAIPSASVNAWGELAVSPPEPVEPGTRVQIEHHPGDTRLSPSTATVTLTATDREGMFQLGDVALEPWSLVCSGRIADFTPPPPPPGTDPWPGPQPTFLFVSVKRDGDRRPTRTRGGEVAEDGRFAVWSPEASGNWSATARGPGEESRPIQFEAGTTNLRLHLERRETLIGRVLLEPDVDPSTLRLQLFDDGEDGARRGSITPEPDGSFAFGSMLGGPYRIQVDSAGWSERAPALRFGESGPLAVFDGLELERPGDGSEPLELDLRGKWFALVVRVEVPGGGPLPGGSTISLADPATLRGGASIGMSGQESLIHLDRMDIAAVVRVPGYRTISRRRAMGRLEETLRPGLPLRVSVAGGSPALPEGTWARVSVSERDRDRWPSGHTVHAPVREGKARCVLPVSGAWNVGLSLHRGDHQAHLRRRPFLVVEVEDSNEVATLEIDYTAEELAEALADLAR